MKIVIIEGTDNTGKDTVIKELTNIYPDSFVYHCGKPTSNIPEQQIKEQEIFFNSLCEKTINYYKKNKENNNLLIHNRSWYGEYVYGCLYRNNSETNVKKMIKSLEEELLKNVDKNDICYITLLSDNMDFLVLHEDGLSISKAKKELIKKETNRFKEIYENSIIPNKHIIYVNNNLKFKNKQDIIKEILMYI